MDMTGKWVIYRYIPRLFECIIRTFKTVVTVSHSHQTQSSITFPHQHFLSVNLRQFPNVYHADNHLTKQGKPINMCEIHFTSHLMTSNILCECTNWFLTSIIHIYIDYWVVCVCVCVHVCMCLSVFVCLSLCVSVFVVRVRLGLG